MIALNEIYSKKSEKNTKTKIMGSSKKHMKSKTIDITAIKSPVFKVKKTSKIAEFSGQQEEIETTIPYSF